MKFNRATRKNVRFVYSPLEPRQLLASGADLVGPDLVADYYVEDQQQELLAREYLATNSDTSSIEEGPSRLELVEIKRGIATTVTRFQQTIHGDPVVDAYVATVQGPTGEFLTVHDQSFHGELDASYVLALNDFEGVEQLAKDHAGVRSTFATSRGQLSWLVNGATAEQVWEMTVFGVNEETHGDFLTFIDANSDKLISQENRISNFESGSGEVFIRTHIKRSEVELESRMVMTQIVPSSPTNALTSRWRV